MAFIHEKEKYRVIDEERGIILRWKGLHASPEGRIMDGRRFEMLLPEGIVTFKMLIINPLEAKEKGPTFWQAHYIDIPEAMKHNTETIFALFDEAVRFFNDSPFHPEHPENLAPTDFSTGRIRYMP